jgi:hypothetical protein
MSAEARDHLAARQAELMRALVSGASAPAGFQADRVRVAASSLRAKRCRSVARAWPSLTTALGTRYEPLFAEYAARPLPGAGSPLEDGYAFARWLRARNQLPDACLRDLLAEELHDRQRASRFVPRRGVALRVALLRETSGLLVGIRLPVAGLLCLTLRLTSPLSWLRRHEEPRRS